MDSKNVKVACCKAIPNTGFTMYKTIIGIKKEPVIEIS